jgi:hypothetical protein
MHLPISTDSSITLQGAQTIESTVAGSTETSPDASRRNSLSTVSPNSLDKAYVKLELGQHISLKDMMVHKEGVSDSDEDTLAEETTMMDLNKNDDEAPYCVFSKQKKWSIVIMAAVATFISPLTANIFLPAMNSMQEVGLYRNTKMPNSIIFDIFSFLVTQCVDYGNVSKPL